MMNVFSFSRLSLYEKCPYHFYKKYVEGYQDPLTYPLALGKGVHKGVECLINGADIQVAIEEGMKEAEFYPGVTEEEMGFLISRAPVSTVKGETEIHFKMPLSNETDSPLIQGFIDVLGDGYIVDWKTNRKTYDVRGNHQIGLYAWAAKQLKGSEHIYGSLYFLRFQRESKYLYTDIEMEKARKWAYNTAKEIQSKLKLVVLVPELKDELFPMKRSSYCGFCPFSLECFRKFSPYAKEIQRKLEEREITV